jgi:phosphoserine phosphatase RsbU/P
VLTYCSAGHNPALLVAGGENDGSGVRWLQPTSPALGLVENAQYKDAKVTVKAGDLLVLYTDGVTEAIDRAEEAFGDERLMSVVKLNAQASAGEILQATRRELERHVGGQRLSDDTTIVVQKVIG